MIYLIQDCYKDDNGNFVDILKIGYSSKPFKESRENQYKTHNYGFKLLQEREGDTELENYLHKRFSKYLLPDSYEWFYYNEEIINGFNVIQNIIATTKEKYIENIKCYLLNTLERPEELYKTYKNNIIEELQNYPEYNKEEEIIYKQRIKEVFELGYSIIKENIEKDCILSNPYFDDIPEEITIDRLNKNPWKNHAELYYRLNTTKKSKEDFEEYLEKKKKETEELLLSYQTSPTSSSKHALAKTYKDLAMFKKYKDNFVAVNEKMGSDLKPVFNKLVMIAEMRAFEIQQTDYANRFSVFNALESIVETEDLNEYLDEFYSLSTRNKYKYLCSLSESVVSSLLPHLPTNFQNYYTVLGPSRIKALRYNVTDIKKEYEGIMGNQNIDIGAKIYEEFVVGGRYTKTYIKDRLGTLYKELGYSKSPKATDLEDYFILNTCRINNEETGKRDAGYLIVSKKEIEIKKGG